MDPISMALGRTVGSALGSIAGRLLKQSGDGIANRIAARNAVKARPSVAHAEALEKITYLTPASREKVAQFVASGEFEQVALQLSIAVSTNKKKDLATLRKSLNESLRLYRSVPERDLCAVSDALFDGLHAAVVSRLSQLNSEKRISLTSAKVASAQAAASARNCDLLAKIEDLRAYDDFHRSISRQVAQIESKVRPPQIDSGNRIAIDRIYVQATLAEEGEDGREGTNETPLLPKDIFDTYPRLVVLGDPGGGKSTLATKLCVDLARGRNKGSASKAPFKVVMRDYAKYFQESRTSIIEYIEKTCGALYSTPAPDGCVDYLLLNSRAAVIFDGLDELTNTALRQDMVSAVEAFAYAYPGTPIMVTSRKVGYDLSPLDSELFETLTLGSFSYEQRESYVRNWFSLMRSGGQQEKARLVSNFMTEVSHARDLSSNPLMLGLMCALYRGAGYIPRNRPELYRRCSEFLFERWDSTRGIIAEKPFERGIQNAMFALALNLMQRSDGASGLTERQLVQFTTHHLHDRHYEDFDVAQDAARQFVEYCRGRAWVLTDVGTDTAGNNLYAFTHRTFLEYFAARQIVRESGSVRSLVEMIYPSLRVQEWDVVSQLAIQTLDERHVDGANEAVLALVEKSKEESDHGPRIAISSFCARAVEFMDLRPAVLRSVADNYLKTIASASTQGDRENKSLGDAARGLLKCPMELRSVIADQIRASISDTEEKTEVLAFALSLEFYADFTEDYAEYWGEVEEQLYDVFSADILRLATSTPWFAARMYEKRKCTLQDVFEWHGVEALFDDGQRQLVAAGGYDNLFTFILYERRFARAISVKTQLSPGESDLRRADVARIIDTLLAASTPWASHVRMHSWVHDEKDQLPDSVDEMFLRVLNVIVGGDRLLGIVTEGRKRFSATQRGSIYLAIMRARRGEISETRLRESLAIFSEERADFVVRWCAHEFIVLENHAF
ncbi:NACHT domain-containing protein [Streptomyces sp. NPDC059161]|uniref:NACHT domain-containing protein n=1 Tax=Streptomyces sp. NPDC059161 TaxID=3346749 RepID=UPI003698AD9A